MDSAAIIRKYFEPHTGKRRATTAGGSTMVTISVSSRSLAAARAVDPNVSAAAVRAAVEVALAEQARQLRRNRPETTRPDRR
jgi:post-segregation antitoxin (ccd killing protein)